jgi:hypothetical protein
VASTAVEGGVPLCEGSCRRVNRSMIFVSSRMEFQEAKHVGQQVRLHLALHKAHGLAVWHVWLDRIFWVWVLVTTWKEMVKGPDESSSTALFACQTSQAPRLCSRAQKVPIRSSVLPAFHSFMPDESSSTALFASPESPNKKFRSACFSQFQHH